MKGRHLVLPAVFRLLYCCGLRCKEARTLARRNVHLDEGYLDIIQSKGAKSRRVHISKELAEYLTVYDRRISLLFPDRAAFFPNREDLPYGAGWLQQNFLRVWYAAFPEKRGSGISIRAYDLRHTFCVRALEQMQEKGFDLYASLPLLSRYLGHKHITETEYYLRLLEEHFGGILVQSDSCHPGLFPKTGGAGE